MVQSQKQKETLVEVPQQLYLMNNQVYASLVEKIKVLT